VNEDLDKVTEFDEGDLNRWMEDGHKVVFKWQRDEIVIEAISCPHEGTNAACNYKRDFCLVQRFLGVYGSEINIGEILLDGPIEVAWTAEEGESDLDSQYACIWVTPVNDISYRSMKLALSDDW
jgi:hypothetical protein